MFARPRFGTWYTSTPVPASTGLRIVKVAEYSTMPRGFLGASSMSVMMAFSGWRGSISPWKRPVSFS
jgi:hypothetical protein